MFLDQLIENYSKSYKKLVALKIKLKTAFANLFVSQFILFHENINNCLFALLAKFCKMYKQYFHPRFALDGSRNLTLNVHYFPPGVKYKQEYFKT